MRFSTVFAALPALASAQDFEQYKAQFQNYLGQFGSYIPNPGHHDPIAAAEAKAGSMRMNILTIDNWHDTLYEPVSPGATTPEEWWILVSGGNKTCFGHCGNVEQAFNETAAKFALLDNAPHVGYINCDNQPILCNAISAGPASLYVIDMMPQPAINEIYKKRINLTTTTSESLLEWHETGVKQHLTRVDPDGWFHPFNGKLAQVGLNVPLGYLQWAFGLVPQWLFMLVISMASRTMMSRRMQNVGGAAPAATQ